jgi:hypothetical protein
MSILPGSMVGEKPAKKPAKNLPTRKRRACLAQTHFRGKNIANANDFWPKKSSNAHSALLKTGQ